MIGVREPATGESRMNGFYDLIDQSNQLAATYDEYRETQIVDLPPGLQDHADFISESVSPIAGKRLLTSWLEQTVEDFGQAERLISPLILDLDGDGFELVSVEDSDVRFDLDADGFAETTGWLLPDDGFLALDFNDDGIINDISELFGNGETSGFVELAALDTNTDGIIDSADARFLDLRIWRDLDQDGVTDPGELSTLTDWNIATIDLDAVEDHTLQAGNLITEWSSFTRGDDTTGEIVDVWFAVDDTQSSYDPRSTFSDPYDLDVEALFLPFLRGYGVVPDLHIAMSLDSGLLDQVRDFAHLDPTTPVNQVLTEVEAIMLRWTGAENVDPTSRGAHIDARHLEALEAFLGLDFQQGGVQADPWSAAAAALEQLWETMVQETAARLLAQGPFTSVMPEVAFDPFDDVLTSDAELQTLVQNAATQAPQSISAAALFWAAALVVLDKLHDQLGEPDPAYAAALNTALAAHGLDGYVDSLRNIEHLGTDGPETLWGTASGDLILGLGGDDTLYGRDGADVLVGGTGNDALRGEEGDDLYLFEAGFGQDEISETNDGGNDAIVLPDGVTPADVLFLRASEYAPATGTSLDLVVRVAGSAEHIEIDRQLSATSQLYHVEELRFDDGTVMDLTGGFTFTGTVAAETITGTDLADTLLGLGGDDTLYGRDGADVLVGGAGNDALRGDEGDDLYLFEAGFGQDEIYEVSGGGTDAIVFGAGIAATDVRLEIPSDTDDLILHVGTDQIHIQEHFTTTYTIEEARFADGTVLDLTANLTQVGTAAGETLWGRSDSDTLLGLAGDDTLYGRDGADVLDGGAGNDSLRGGAGDDLYLFEAGFGQDEIDESNDGGNDAIVLPDGVTPADVLLLRATDYAPAAGSFDDLVVRIAGSADHIVINQQLSSVQAYHVEEARFENGAVIDLTSVPLSMGDVSLMGEFGRVTGLTHEPQTVQLGRSYIDPVVFALPPSAIGADPSTVRLSDVRSDRFTLQIQEPNYKDGWHITEEVSYVVLEAGRWMLEGGALLEVGTLNTSRLTSQGWENVAFDQAFGQVSATLSQVQTFNGPDFVRTRQQDVGPDGFRVALEEEEALNTGIHAEEKVGYFALSPGAGEWSGNPYQAGSTAADVTNDWHHLDFSVGFAATPEFLGALASFDGADPAGLRYRALDSAGVDVRVEEEASLDAETWHTSEAISYLALGGSGELVARPIVQPLGGSTAVAEYGEVEGLTHAPRTVVLEHNFIDPVVIALPPSSVGSDPATVRISNVQSDRFTLEIQEPSYLDGQHVAENVSYFVVEAGTWRLPDGTQLEAGSLTSDKLSPQGIEQVAFAAGFDVAPVVFSQVQSKWGPDWVVTRELGVSETGFALTMQEEESLNSGSHVLETLGWLAIEPASGSWDGRGFQADRVVDVDNNGVALSLADVIDTTPQFLAALETFHGPDPGGLRYASLDADSVAIRVEEEASFDAETEHVGEAVEFFAIEGQGILTADPTDTVVI